MISQLEQDKGTIVGEDNLKVYITELYKKLFGTLNPNSVSLVQDNIKDIPQLSQLEDSNLTSDFLKKEVLEEISQMEHSKAS
jgi:hypothetical protein